MQLGKFSSDSDSALHFLCLSDWANDSFGNVEAPTGYVWKISNYESDVSSSNTEFTSILEEWNKYEMNTDNQEFRRSLLGHFLLQEDSNGFVHVRKYETDKELCMAFDALQAEYEKWDSQEEGD